MRVLVLVAAVVAVVGAQQAAKPAPEQPIPYSHKTHAGDLKLQCKMCHTNPDPGELMRYPAVSVCMGCHSTIKTDSLAIQKLAEFAKADRPVPWVRVYQIPSYVNFSHRSHIAANTKCEDCHGQVAQRTQLAREGDISMGGCMECHRIRKSGLDCILCHDQRQ